MLSGPKAVTSRAKHKHCCAGTKYLDLLCEVISFYGERLPELIEESRSLFRRHECKFRLHTKLNPPLIASGQLPIIKLRCHEVKFRLRKWRGVSMCMPHDVETCHG